MIYLTSLTGDINLGCCLNHYHKKINRHYALVFLMNIPYDIITDDMLSKENDVIAIHRTHNFQKRLFALTLLHELGHIIYMSMNEDKIDELKLWDEEIKAWGIAINLLKSIYNIKNLKKYQIKYILNCLKTYYNFYKELNNIKACKIIKHAMLDIENIINKKINLDYEIKKILKYAINSLYKEDKVITINNETKHAIIKNIIQELNHA